MPRRTSYGPLVRIVRPGRHVYRTVMTTFRWLLAVVGTAISALLGRIAISSFSPLDENFSLAFGVLFGLLALAGLAATVMALSFRTVLEITPVRVRLRQSGYVIFGSSDRNWTLREVVGVGIVDVPTFHVGGSTPIHGVVLKLADGDFAPLNSSFDDVPSAEKLMSDITQSIRRARAAPESL